MRLRHLLLAVVVVLTLATTAAADRPVPGSSLQLWIIGRAHTSFTVAITNPTDTPATFDATGLYFVPVAKAEAPQRLGVVTPGHLSSLPNAAEAWNGIPVAPHATVQVTLTSYCLDVNRQGPPEEAQYRLADVRLPSELSDSLAREARTIARSPTASYSATQSAVWRIRGEMPAVRLLGETH